MTPATDALRKKIAQSQRDLNWALDQITELAAETARAVVGVTEATESIASCTAALELLTAQGDA